MIQPKNKTILIKGLKGDTGNTGIDSTIPLSGLIAIKDEIEMPAGYELYEYVEDGTLIGITATYNQTATITDQSSLDDLRPDLTVISEYDNGHTYVITDYTLSGTLEVGTSTITVSYKGFTDTFDVTVSSSITYLYNWDFTQSLTDSVQNKTVSLSNATFTQGTGIVGSNANNTISFPSFNLFGKTLEVDFASLTKSGTSTLLSLLTKGSNNRFCYSNNTDEWLARLYNSGQSATYKSTQTNFTNTTFKFVFTNNHMSIYTNGDLFYSGGTFVVDLVGDGLTIGYSAGGYGLYTVTAVRIYANQ